MPVNNQHPDYKRMVDAWVRCRDVACGQDAVHAAGEKYLPKLKEQEQRDYDNYLKRTPFYNATWRTIAGLVGMVFRKPPVLTASEKLKAMLEDVTLGGVPMQMFAQEVCEEALKVGRLGVLVDYPSLDVNRLTLADANAMNARPFLALYYAEAIINWRVERVNNVLQLTLVVLKEVDALPKDEFTDDLVTRFRVLDLAGGRYRVRKYEMRNGQDVQLGSDQYPLMGNQPLPFIPFTFLSEDATSFEVEDPPLIDLVNINLAHYRNSADLEHGAHFTGLPTPYVCGATAEDGAKMYIGSSAAWLIKDPQATVGYLEFTGQGLSALSGMLEAKEKQMAVLGARMLEQQKKAVQTADTESIHRKGEESMLAATAQALSLGLTKALTWFAQWAGEAGEVKYELNRDFYPQPMTAPMLLALVSAWQSGAFSDQTMFDNLQGAEIVSDGTTLEEEQARSNSAAPALTGQGVDPATGGPAAPPEKLPKPKVRGKITITNPKGEQYTIDHGGN